jgi:D,D-heptose 1,7-bisphosphate phosphatase
MSNTKQKAVFLDRDDTLIEDPGYINHPGQVKLLPGAAASLVQLRKMDFRVVVVSNQSGVARGIFTEEMLAQIHHQLEKLLADEGAYLDAIYYCPYHPDGVVEKYRIDSDMRKPAPGMLLKAAEDLNIDMSRSWMIGDSYRDIGAGKRAGCKTVLINNPGKPVQKNPSDPQADRQAVNIREAVNIIRMYELRQSIDTTLEQRQNEPEQAEPAQPAAALPVEVVPHVVSEPVNADKTATVITPAVEVPAQQKQIELPVVEEITQPAKTVRIEPEVPTMEHRAEPNYSPREMPVEKPLEPVIQKPVEKTAPTEPAGVRSPKVITPEEPQMSSRTEKLLHELISHLRSVHRVGQYENFTLSKVLAGVAQVLAAACLVVSLWFCIDSTRGGESILIMLGYAAVLQLMAIAFYIMRDRG